MLPRPSAGRDQRWTRTGCWSGMHAGTAGRWGRREVPHRCIKGKFHTGRLNARASVSLRCIYNYSRLPSHRCPTPPLVAHLHITPCGTSCLDLPRRFLSDGAESGRLVPSLRRPRRPPFSCFNHSTGLLSACHPLFPSNSGRFTTNNEDVRCSTFCGYCESQRKLHYSSGDALFRPREEELSAPWRCGEKTLMFSHYKINKTNLLPSTF